MKDNSIPLDRDEGFIRSDGISDFRTICGYCTQGRHSECRGYFCDCGEKNHRTVL
jgi:hypothetical protein